MIKIHIFPNELFFFCRLFYYSLNFLKNLHNPKVAVSRDFLAFFILLIQPIWAPDKQFKMVSLKNSFSGRYSNF